MGSGLPTSKAALPRSKTTAPNADGSGHRTLEGPSGSISDPAWSPDGQRIAYVKSSIAQIEDHRYSVWNYEIWMVGADSGVTAAE